MDAASLAQLYAELSPLLQEVSLRMRPFEEAVVVPDSGTGMADNYSYIMSGPDEVYLGVYEILHKVAPAGRGARGKTAAKWEKTGRHALFLSALNLPRKTYHQLSDGTFPLERVVTEAQRVILRQRKDRVEAEQRRRHKQNYTEVATRLAKQFHLDDSDVDCLATGRPEGVELSFTGLSEDRARQLLSLARQAGFIQRPHEQKTSLPSMWDHLLDES